MRKTKIKLVVIGTVFSASLFSQVNVFPALGNAGSGTPTPAYQFHVIGTNQANAQTWKEGIVQGSGTALYWDGGTTTNQNYFMGHASTSPVGNFFTGSSVGINPNAPVDYFSEIYVTTASFSGINPLGTTQFRKNLLVFDPTSQVSTRRFGVNILDPKRTADFLSIADPQLRLTHTRGVNIVNGAYTDFHTSNFGHLNIMPRFNGAGRNVGIDIPFGTAPSAKLDVNGNARLRNVPSGSAEYIMLGRITTPGGTGANDVTFRKLAFSGSSTDVLLGDGTWGTLPSAAPAANNGLSILSSGIGNFIRLGQNCNEPGDPGKLLNNRQIPMNNFNLYFTGQGTPTTNAIALGYPACFVPLPAKFNTLQENSVPVAVPTIGGSFINRDELSSAGAITGLMGISDKAQSTAGVSNVGGDFRAANAPINIAVSADAAGNSGSSSSIAGQFTSFAVNPGSNVGVTTRVSGGNTNIGVVGSGTGGNLCYGVQATSIAGNTNYGVYATAGGGANSYGIYASNAGGCSPNHWAGYFQGDVNINGCGTYALTVNGAAFLSSGSLWTTSDKNYKKDFKQLENVREKINKLTGYTYFFKTAEFPDKKFESTEQIGLVAQELKEVFPQLVTTDEKGFMAVNYQGMVPVLLEAIKDQQKQISELKNLVESSVTLNPSVQEQRNIGCVNLKDAQSIILEQNVPNPFAEQTTISYQLIEGVQKAQILFYNAEGKLINSSELKAVSGKGQLNVFASDLSNGIYSYTLVVDGKIIETKRMVKN